MKHAPWYSKKVRSLKNQRNKAHRTFKATGSRSDELKFLALRNEFESSQANSFKVYLEKVQNGIASDPSSFWKYVKARKNTADYPIRLSCLQVYLVRRILKLFAVILLISSKVCILLTMTMST